MRIVERQEFLSMPAGTVYHKRERGLVFGSLEIKRENAGDNDWYAQSFGWVEADSSGEADERLMEMIDDPTVSYPVDDSECRDGCFDEDQSFLVYEFEDVWKLLTAINGAELW